MRFVFFFSALSIAACAGNTVDEAAQPSGATSSDPTSAPDADGCCPPSPSMSGSMYLGGAASEGRCFRTHDFWCSQNWRVEKDAKGCDQWRYDMRAPREDESPQCQRKVTSDAGAD
ncbi:MAG: hypothetical protein KF819_24395 [Labilithrix sp.]|nr:hypothetical protein [Labilithrix sp.]